jgi:hypothetical protein
VNAKQKREEVSALTAPTKAFRILVPVLILSILAATVFAIHATSNLRVYASRINYPNASLFGVRNTTLYFTLVENGTINMTTLTVIYPNAGMGFNFTHENACGFPQPASIGCTCNSSMNNSIMFNCSGSGLAVTPGATVGFVLNLSNLPSIPEYNVSLLSNISAFNGSTVFTADHNVSFLNIQDGRLFHTLIEFGRGRGNYFYDCFGGATSAGTGIGYNATPALTEMELNFLHKVVNAKPYYGLPNALATNASFMCLYPNASTVVREHLVEYIKKESAGTLPWNASYLIPEIEGSWERMGYLGQQYSSLDQAPVGRIWDINCTNIAYRLPDAGGNVSIPRHDCRLEVRSPDALNITARPEVCVLGNGTAEAIVLYSIKNIENYPVTEVRIEIGSPQAGPTELYGPGDYADFIGTRGELWGDARDKFELDRIDLRPGETENITLVLRFNTTRFNASVNDTATIGATQFRYVQTWEANAYNPTEYIQTITPASNGPSGTGNCSSALVNSGNPGGVFNMSQNVSIVSVQASLQNINNILVFINGTTIAINNTVNNINTIVTDIQTTTNNISLIVGAINFTLGQLNLTATISQIRDNVTTILSLIERSREFEDELVFLVTDAVVQSDRAQRAAEAGDAQEAMDALRAANDRLQQAASRLNEVQAQRQRELDLASSKSAGGGLSSPLATLSLVLLLLAAAVIYFLLRKRQPPREEQR